MMWAPSAELAYPRCTRYADTDERQEGEARQAENG